MSVTFTEEQKKAVYGEKANCLVSAAAGSGKTQVLTGRILRRVLEENVDIHRILVVTFTKAAAAEMRARIAENLTKALGEDPGNTHLQKQASLLGSAAITTMDSFCLQLLRTHFAEAGIDGAFRVADATEANLLRAEAAQQALEEMYKSEDAAFLDFAGCYSTLRDDSVLCEYAISLYAFAESMPDPEGWLIEKASMYDMKTERDFEESLFAKTILQNVRLEISDLATECAHAAGMFSACPSYVDAFEKDRVALLKLLENAESWNRLLDAFDMFSWAKRGRETKSALSEMAEETRKSIKKKGNDLLASITLASGECAEIMRSAAPHVRALCAYTLKYAEQYAAIKQEKNLLDYSDLEHMAIRLLSVETEEGIKPSPIAEALRERYDEIYIDEYQDSNDVQEMLFTLLSGESIGKPNMFMVGDMKQSIYGFRKTSPELFIRKNDTYTETGPCRKVALTRNFRSRKEILSFVNTVFESLMHRSLGGIDYTEEERLNPGAPYPESEEVHVEFALCEREGTAAERLVDEAEVIVKKIREALSGTVYDLKKGAYRKAEFRDIAVIMRSARDMAAPLRAACEAAGIPLYCDIGGGYLETVEVSVFLSLLRTIDNPQDDIPLLATMRAPFFGFTEDELAQIRLMDRKRLYYFAVSKMAAEKTPLGKKCADFLQKIRAWRRAAAFLPTDTLILRLFDETGYLLFVSGTRGGTMARANLELLFEKAHRFEKTSFRGLFHFLQYMDSVAARGEEMSEAKLVGEGDNVVRLMSIHKSKGLEFPVVILAGTGKAFNRKSVQGPFLLHKDLGIGLSNIEPKRRIRYDTPAKTAIRLQKRNDEMGEELRVLYVALTRAKERLIITGAATEEDISLWKQTLSVRSEILHAPSFLSLLVQTGACAEGVKLGFEPRAEADAKMSGQKKKVTPLPPTDLVREALEYRYARPELRTIPSKISVTEYKRLREEGDEISLPLYREVELRQPRFRSMGGNIRGAAFGTLMHFVMQGIPYEKIQTRADVKAYVDSLEQKEILSPEQTAAVDIDKIFAFWDGEMGHRIRAAEKVYREMPFTQMVPASLLTGEAAHADERLVVQGIIDCFFFEKNGIVLLDYKTDAPKPKAVIAARYKTQLDCYEMALRQKYFSEISQKVIYLFANNGIIEVD